MSMNKLFSTDKETVHSVNTVELIFQVLASEQEIRQFNIISHFLHQHLYLKKSF